MQKLTSIIGGLITLVAGYHLYLNISNPQEYSFEHSIKLLKILFCEKPITFILLSTAIIVILGFCIDKIWSLLTENHFIEKNKIISSLERTKIITDNKNAFYEKVFITFNSIKNYPLNPMNRINADFKEINIKDITDSKFPYSNYMSKYEVFDFKENGIELLGGENITGFNLLINEENNWDVLNKNDKVQSGKYWTPEDAYAISFLHYEDIIHIDWSPDSIEGNITLSCNFKYKLYRKHPFKEFRYYIQAHNLGYRLLEPANRKNFTKFGFLKPFKIFIAATKKKISKIKTKQPKHLWR